MFPVINLKETGINLRRIMDKRGISAKDIQEYLNRVYISQLEQLIKSNTCLQN